jgi:uncharacterized protein (DUF2147 family)
MTNLNRGRWLALFSPGAAAEPARLTRVQHRTIGIREKGVLRTVLLACLLAASSAFAQPGGSPQSDPTGEWLVAKQIARIKIVNCNDQLWGMVSWEARPGTDSKNPDPRLRNRPTLGMPILLGMTRTKANQWDGQIYNSEDGQTYSANISLANPDTLKVQGCVLGFLCGGENWARVQAPEANTPDPSSPSQAARKSSTSRQTAKDRQPSTQSGTAAGNQTETDNDVCSRLLSPTGLPH